MDIQQWWKCAEEAHAAWAAARERDPKSDETRRWRAMMALDTWLALRARAGDNVAQRTPAWYARRGHTVGGSQLGKLAGVSSYGKPWDVVKDTAQARGWRGGRERRYIPMTAWGTALEDLSILLLEAMGAMVRESGALWGPIAGHSNSPDGVGWLDPAALGRFLITQSDAGGQVGSPVAAPATLHLLEFKSYYSRKLDQKPHHDHREQVYGGLDAVPHARAGLLLNTVSRRCSLKEWFVKPGYNPVPLLGRPKEIYPELSAQPEALGVVVFHFGPADGPGLHTPPETWPRGRGSTGYPPIDADASPQCSDIFAFLQNQTEPPSESQRYTAARLRLMWLAVRARGKILDLGEEDPRTVNEVLWMAEEGMLWRQHALMLVADPHAPADAPRQPRGPTERLETLAAAGIYLESAVAVLPVKILGIEAHRFARPTCVRWGDSPRVSAMRRRVWAALEAADQLVEGADEGEVQEKFMAVVNGRRSPPPPRRIPGASPAG